MKKLIPVTNETRRIWMENFLDPQESSLDFRGGDEAKGTRWPSSTELGASTKLLAGEESWSSAPREDQDSNIEAAELFGGDPG